jgi:hypothetical protein
LPTKWLARFGGCTFAEAHDRSGMDAVVAWSRELDPTCAMVEVRRCSGGQIGFQIDRFADRATVIVARTGCEHVTINDGHFCWRFDILAGSVLNGPVNLGVVIDDMARANQQLATVQRLIALHNNPASFGASRPRTKNNLRIATALRVSDALGAGASYRQIAITLFGEARVRDEWNGASDSMRSRVRRLVGLANDLAAGGWQTLLL